MRKFPWKTQEGIQTRARASLHKTSRNASVQKKKSTQATKMTKPSPLQRAAKQLGQPEPKIAETVQAEATDIVKSPTKEKVVHPALTKLPPADVITEQLALLNKLLSERDTSSDSPSIAVPRTIFSTENYVQSISSASPEELSDILEELSEVPEELSDLAEDHAPGFINNQGSDDITDFDDMYRGEEQDDVNEDNVFDDYEAITEDHRSAEPGTVNKHTRKNGAEYSAATRLKGSVVVRNSSALQQACVYEESARKWEYSQLRRELKSFLIALNLHFERSQALPDSSVQSVYKSIHGKEFRGLYHHIDWETCKSLCHDIHRNMRATYLRNEWKRKGGIRKVGRPRRCEAKKHGKGQEKRAPVVTPKFDDIMGSGSGTGSG
ncbi:hypothetical protein RUND412_002180 [Rhizina undulata]